MHRHQRRCSASLYLMSKTLPINAECSSSLCVSVVSLLKDLKHANIVTLHDIVHTDKSLTLVFEYLVRRKPNFYKHDTFKCDFTTLEETMSCSGCVRG